MLSTACMRTSGRVTRTPLREAHMLSSYEIAGKYGPLYGGG